MFYEAMKRRGWHPKLQDLQAVVTIHSPASERAWSEVCTERLVCTSVKVLHISLHRICGAEVCGPQPHSIQSISTALHINA